MNTNPAPSGEPAPEDGQPSSVVSLAPGSALLIGGPHDGLITDDPYRMIVHYYDRPSDMIHVYQREDLGRYAYRGSQRGFGISSPNAATQTRPAEPLKP